MDLFLDSNVLLKYLAGDPLAIEVVEKHRGYINNVVMSEVTYGYIRAKTGLSPLELKKRFKRISIDMSPVEILLNSFVELPTPPAKNILSVVKKYHLLPNDATIVATMQAWGITHIATFDEDFKRVPGITLLPKAYWKNKV